MKKFGQIKAAVSVLFLLITVTGALAQDSLEKIWISAEQMPEFPGGQAELLKYIAASVDYPDEAANQGITGRVMVQFVVNTDGSLSDIHIARSIHPSLDSAAVKMVREMPKWSAGKQKDQEVRVKVVIPVNFAFQTLPPDQDSIYSVVQKMPSFPGGQSALSAYLDTALIYPLEALRNLKEGHVYVTFILDKTGKVRSAEVEERFDRDCNLEAVRLVKAMPDWSPGKVRAYPVEVRQRIMIPFEIKGDYLLDGSKYIMGEYGLNPTDSISLTADKLPEFPGGDMELNKFISKNLLYPVSAIENNRQGRVLVEFIVDENGEITHVGVINICYHELAEAALNVVNAMPKWTPGESNGLPVKVRVVLPVRFKLN